MHWNHTRLATYALGLSLLASAFVACGDDEEAAAPTATVVFTHNNSAQGELEVLINDEVASKLMPGQLTNGVTVATGASTLSVRATGATSNLIDGEMLNLDAQTYLVALLGNTTEAPSIWLVDKTPPEGTADDHYVEVVNIRTDDLGLNVFVGTESAAMAPAAKTVTDFLKVPTGEASVSLSFADGGAPTGVAESVTLAGGGASMIIVGGDGMDDITLNILPVK